MANRFVQAKSFGGAFRAGQPRLIVVHSLEAPARRGLAYDLAKGWIQGAGVSPQHMTDPGETVDLLRPGIVGYHCGNGNQVSVGLEVTGYAGWSEDEWLAPEAFAAVRLDARQGAIEAQRYGIPMRWLSLSQIRNGERGFCTHNDISLTLGGTNHWDPGPNFPFGIFMQMVQQFAGGWDGKKDDPKPETPSAPGPGGAEPEDDDMMLSTIQAADGPNSAAIFAVGPGHWHGIADLEAYSVGVEAGLFKPVKTVANQRSLDVARAIALQLTDGESNVTVAK